jgi:hypothetical protein
MILNSTFNTAVVLKQSGGGTSVKLSGYIMDDASTEILSRGFNYGETIEMEDSKLSSDNTPEFFAVVKAKSPLYYQAFVTNSFGTFNGDVKQILI